MNKTKRSAVKRSPTRSKRTQQMSLGGILLTAAVALITWWSGLGSQSAAPLPTSSPTPLVEAAAPTLATTPSAASEAALPQIKVVDIAKPDTPTPTPTSPAKATRKAEQPATPTATRPAKATRKTTQPATATPTRTKPPPPTAKPPTPTPTRRITGVSGLPTIRYDQLPREARRTIDLIDRGGPFPFYKDGDVFQNRERRLPRKSRNYYHEYTVVTPGEDDRGARRIVAGDGGELYYTDDHYESFREVVR